MEHERAIAALDAAAERDGFRVFVAPAAGPLAELGYLAELSTRWSDDWTVSGWLRISDGRLVLSGLTIALSAELPASAHEPGRERGRDDVPPAGITSAVLRAIPLGRLLAQARLALLANSEWAAAATESRRIAAAEGAEVPALVEEIEALFGIATSDQRERATAAGEAARSVELRRGRRGYPDDHYRRIALAYLELQETGMTKGILNALAEQEGRPRETIRDWVHQARKRKFLTDGTRGRAGAEPGARLYEFESADPEEKR